MTILNFNASFQTTPEQTLAFAKFKGYQEKVNNQVTAEDGSIFYDTIDNPQSPENFVCEYMKGVLAKEIAQMVHSQIEQAGMAQINTEKEQALSAIKESLEVGLE